MIPFGPPQWIVLAVVAQRLAELVLARRNAARLLAAGGREHGAGHYPLFFVVQGGWLVALFALTPPDAPLHWGWLAAFVALQAGRVWVIASLGRFWTTRVITVPGAVLVRRGPYRWCRHPNYVVVAGEIAVLPLAFGQWEIALAASAASALLLWHRIRVEEAALAAAR
jgi:methyltransferase